MANTIEAFAALDPITLSDADDVTEALTKNGITFTRAIDITVNADQSRTVDVEVSEDEGHLTVSAQGSSTYALWGMQ